MFRWLGQSISFSSFFEGIPLQFVKHFTNTGCVVTCDVFLFSLMPFSLEVNYCAGHV